MRKLSISHDERSESGENAQASVKAARVLSHPFACGSVHMTVLTTPPNHDEELACRLSTVHLYAVALFYPWFKVYFPLFRGMVMYDIKFERKGNKI